MKRLYEKYENGRELGFLTVSVAPESDPEYMRQIARDNGILFPVLLDPSLKLSETYSASGIPITYFIDRAGVVRDRIPGAGNLARFEEGLEKILPK